MILEMVMILILSHQCLPQKRQLFSSSVFIDENIWIGESVSILPGVRIGKSAIIGANSVVTKDVPDIVLPQEILQK
jgi:acetyltransferase-like isoleucine patch superfamily enzyme